MAYMRETSLVAKHKFSPALLLLQAPGNEMGIKTYRKHISRCQDETLNKINLKAKLC